MVYQLVSSLKVIFEFAWRLKKKINWSVNILNSIFLYPNRLRWGKHAEGGWGELRFPPSSKLVFIPF
jgi:hypothetical protein